MKKTICIGLVMAFLLMPMSMAMAVIPTENIIENGTFDTNLDSWDVTESDNFTISADGGYANFNTTDTDVMTDFNYTDFINGTMYNMTIHNGSISGVGDAYLEFTNTTTTENINPYFNESLGNWTYSETKYTTNFIRGNYSLFNHSSPQSYAIESRKLSNAEIINDTFDSEPDGLYVGEGSSKYIYDSGNNRMDCNWTTAQISPADDNFARYYYPIGTKNETMDFSMSFEFTRNASGIHDALSNVVVGFFNTDETTNGQNALLIDIRVGTSEVSHSVWYNLFIDNGTNRFQASGGGFLVSTLTWGVVCNLTYDATNKRFMGAIYNKTTWVRYNAGVGVLQSGDHFEINAAGICNADYYGQNPARNYQGYIDNIIVRENTTGLPTTAWGQINQTFDVSADSNVTIELYRSHKHDAQLGYIRSAGELIYNEPEEVVLELVGSDSGTLFWLNNSRIINATMYLYDGSWDILVEDSDYELNYTTGFLDASDLGGLSSGDHIYAWYNYSKYESIYNESTTSTSSWARRSLNIELEKDKDYDVRLWTYHTLTEGNTSYVAKGTYWDDCWVNSTSYAWNGTYTSPVFNRSYFADWLRFETIFEKPFNASGYNLTAYMRCGNKETVEPVNWTNWQKVTDFALVIFDPEIIPKPTYESYTGTIPCPNNQYIQYTLMLWTTSTASTPRYLGSAIHSVPIMISKDWGELNQEVTKSYTDDVTLKYKYKIDHLNNSKNGSFHVWVDDYLVEQYNFTYFTTSWISREWALPTTYNASGTYDVRARAYFEFNSTNGTGTILWDDVEFIIEYQSPTITEFNIINGTAIQFNGTFTDYSRGSDYQFLGLDGIDTINITVGVHELEVDDITYLGDGEFFFEYLWASTPFEICNTTILNATVRVTDVAGLYDEATDSLVMPTVTQFIIALMTLGFLVMIIMLIFERHLVTAWDTDKTKKDERLLPDSITGKGGK